jgi:hypothetical protein
MENINLSCRLQPLTDKKLPRLFYGDDLGNVGLTNKQRQAEALATLLRVDDERRTAYNAKHPKKN